ncbi:MAG: PspC domain-containing protein [Bifidobacteriaceae bacterium]|jgi:phage shock protein PspC (stress-responsive transcriptional regulator)|nr:PspC domain-containing protein [Bifidobacteriaceae bacterium]MCI1915472.1 PspC domain-containing protein [Bifidobacteriaceae bacterium]
MTQPSSGGPNPQDANNSQNYENQPPNHNRAGHEFFQWLRQIGIRRGANRWIGGVCSGVANRLGWDPLLVRIIWFALCFVGGAGVALYGIAWLLLPDARDGSILVEEITFGHVTPGFVLSILMVLSGVTGSTATIPLFGVGLIVTIVLIIAAIAVLATQNQWGQTWEEGWRYDEASGRYVRDPHSDRPGPQQPQQAQQAQDFAQPWNVAPETPASAQAPFAQSPQAPQTPPSPQSPRVPPKYYGVRKPANPAFISAIYGLLFLIAAAAACMAFLVPQSSGMSGLQWFMMWVLVADVIVGLSLIGLGIAGRRSSSIGWMVAPLLICSIFVWPANANIVQHNAPNISASVVMTSQTYTADDFSSISPGLAAVMSDVTIDLTDWNSSNSTGTSSGSETQCPTGDLNLHATFSSVTIEIPTGCAWTSSDLTTIAATVDGTHHTDSSTKDAGLLRISGSSGFSSIEIDQE